jgi:hypothetical protein
MKKYALELNKEPAGGYRTIAESNDLDQIMLRFTEHVEAGDADGVFYVIQYPGSGSKIALLSYHWTRGIKLYHTYTGATTRRCDSI